MTRFTFSLHLYNIVPKSFTLIYIPSCRISDKPESRIAYFRSISHKYCLYVHPCRTSITTFLRKELYLLPPCLVLFQTHIYRAFPLFVVPHYLSKAHTDSSQFRQHLRTFPADTCTFFRSRLTIFRIPARAVSFFCQSIVRFLRSISVSSRVKAIKVSFS